MVATLRKRQRAKLFRVASRLNFRRWAWCDLDQRKRLAMAHPPPPHFMTLQLDEWRTASPKTHWEFCGAPIDRRGDCSAGDGQADALQAVVRIALWYRQSPTATGALLTRLADPAASMEQLRIEIESATGQRVTRQAIGDRLRRAAKLWPELAPILQPRACGRFKDRPESRGGKPTHRRTGIFLDGRKIA